MGEQCGRSVQKTCNKKMLGDLKTILSEMIRVPISKFNLCGWVHKNDHLVMDSDVLRDLHLPLDNTLFILTPDLPVVSNPENKMGDPVLEEYSLLIKNTDTKQEINIKCLGQKTVEEMTISELGMSKVSTLEVKSLRTKNNNVQSSSVDREPHVVDLDVDSDNDDETYDDAMEIENFSSSALKPLMPENSTDQVAATESFSNEFQNRYGEPHPIFYIGSLDDAVRDSLLCKARERKMLAVYLHHDNSILSNVFCSQVLCKESLVSYLTNNFICWAWDLTFQSNRKILLQNCTKHFGSMTSSSINKKIESSDSLPVLLIISRNRGTNEVLELIEGNGTLIEIMPRLIHAAELNRAQMESEISEETRSETSKDIFSKIHLSSLKKAVVIGIDPGLYVANKPNSCLPYVILVAIASNVAKDGKSNRVYLNPVLK
ncbi:hypothetical protein HELRODRAFT_168118 [Helobdella robusta]|uniref:UAS domain-containing protein n=1 Tax=Helobdella robusta TaxID=6412 RepID=T1F067_HELRO|nr:hypothetical protein HELRODRAFT_168118 [Helobdella robusta]ESO10232.1 hypothetical protein HELRODRAFT_168118 [Helobdella robusta]